MNSAFGSLIDEAPIPDNGPRQARVEGERRHRRRRKVAIAAFTALAVVATVGLVGIRPNHDKELTATSVPSSPPTTNVPTGLDGLHFASTAVTESGADRPLVGARPIRLSFDGGRVHADPGCNALDGQYSLEGDRLTVTELTETQMACSDTRLSDQDQWFADLLIAGPTIALSRNQLIVTTGDTVITFLLCC